MKHTKIHQKSVPFPNIPIYKALFFLSLFLFGIIFQSIQTQSVSSSKVESIINLQYYIDENGPSDYIDENRIPKSANSEETIKINENQFDPVGSIELDELLSLGSPSPFFSYQLLNIVYDESYRKYEFMGTVNPFNTTNAELDIDTGHRNGDVWIKINETCRWVYYDNATEWLIGITPSLLRWQGIEMALNGTKLADNLVIMNSTGMFYNFSQQFEANKNGSLIMSFIYKAPLPVRSARVQTNAAYQTGNILTNLTTTVNREFYYNVSIGKNEEIIDATGIFKFTLPDYQYFTLMQVYKKGVLSINNSDNYKIINKIFYHECNLSAPTDISATFRTNFTIEVISGGNGSWYQDRLIEGLSIRQRDYKIRVIEGPPTLMLRYFWINETTIPYPDLRGGGFLPKSQLGRPIATRNMNMSTPRNPNVIEDNSTINETKFVDGISFIGGNDTVGYYYISKGEVDIISVSYYAKYFLTAIITDKIATPLASYTVIPYYQGVQYGPVMRREGGVGYPNLVTDRNGQISINYVPYGNYSLQIINPLGETVGFYNASSLLPNNVIKSDVEHFPTIQLVFLGICVITLIGGIQIFKRRDAFK